MADLLDFDAKNARNTVIAGVMSLVAIIAFLWLFGISVTAEEIAWLLVGFLALALFAQRSGELTVGFTIISIALAMVLAEYVLPGFVVDAFSPISVWIRSVTGFDPASIEPLESFVLSLAFVTLMIMARLRITGQKKFLVPLVDRTAKELARYVSAYVNIARIMVLFLLAGFVVVVEQSGVVVGEFGNLVAEVPYFVAAVGVAILGFFTHGGSLPVIGNLPFLGAISARGWLVVSLIIILLAVAAKEEGSGPITQFLRRRS